MTIVAFYTVFGDAFLLSSVHPSRQARMLPIRNPRKAPRMASLRMSTNNPNNFNLDENGSDDSDNYDNIGAGGPINSTFTPPDFFKLKGRRPRGVGDRLEGISQGPGSEESQSDDNEVSERTCIYPCMWLFFACEVCGPVAAFFVFVKGA
jgi:hypothetical protein